MQTALPLAVAILCGVIFGVQVPTNGLLNKTVGSPVFAGFIIIATGAVVMAATVLATRAKMQLGWAGATPWYAFLGGVYEAAGVTLAAWVTPKLGAGTSLVILVVTQVILGVSLDHIGAFGLDKHPVSVLRVAGCAVAVGGAVMVAKG